MDNDSLAARTCNICGSVFSRRDNMRIHRRTAKKCLTIQNQLRQGIDATGAPIQMFPRIVGYPAHAISNVGPPPLIPFDPIVGTIPHPTHFANPGRPWVQLKQPLAPATPSSKRTLAAANLFQCDKCDEVLSSRAGLKHHIHAHHSVKQLDCNFCDAHFIRRQDLMSHIGKYHSHPRVPLPTILAPRAPAQVSPDPSTSATEFHVGVSRDPMAMAFRQIPEQLNPRTQHTSLAQPQVTEMSAGMPVMVYKCPICLQKYFIDLG